MDNFLPLVQGLVAARGVVQLAGDNALPEAIAAMLADPAAAAALAARGSAVLASHRGATQRTLGVLNR
jgi:3-deoxy-D-manno-octulosonic-acid transferase